MIRILIVDDQSFTRKAIQAILEKEADFQVIGQAANGIEALKFIQQNRPDIALVDLEMPEMNGFSLTYQVAQDFAETKVVILSACEDRDSIDTAVKAGARGYLLKTTSGQEISDTIRYVQRGYFQLGPGLFEKILSSLNNIPPVTTEELSRFQNSSQRTVEKLEAEMLRKNDLVRRDLFNELERQIDSLKQDFRKGLEVFQQRVGDRMNQGLNSLSDRFEREVDFDPHIWEKQINARDLERQQQVNRMLTGTKKSMLNLEKKVDFLRNCLIFLAVTFLAEKIAMFVF
ncbi:Response regulator containing a CheY-like receiver domain and an HTH DNA-binding domain [Hyella patelloides LEGE 07179]|uniref:Response regulator containing a CheY-like receiver domain and an HTH DNA-binding domain n=1 Tax=Hyella patelloides LEGE 07179 TaxID=945734 RepID=A0A563VP46_9CYAN|nr:response regulator transcription factor [Hyella patelloides]VEP13226.1 Response regulator containing a CheY-like receiver domain and an HTH DNA-binding domain [Hyella patelloides LEGE 07179]